LGDAHFLAMANPGGHFARGIKGGAEPVIGSGHPEAAAKVRPALGVVVLATTGAERVHQQERAAISNARRVVFRIAQYHVRRGEITQRFEIWQDRKSTRLNSSHVAISYAVFCLKKKKKKHNKKNVYLNNIQIKVS